VRELRPLYAAAATIATVAALGCAVWIWRVPWVEAKIDFDVLGVVWLIANAPKLLAWGGLLMFGVMAAWLWLRVWWET
jgi:hypothetical protein